jgi:hypothetical protein
MTAKREAELETENRMLREQVASLEKIIAGMQPAFRLDSQPVPYYVPYPQPYWYWPGWQVTCAAPYAVSSGNINLTELGGNMAIGGSGSVEVSTAVLS